MRAGQLAASDPTRALAIARAIPDPWYRCQALTSIARAAPEKYVAQAFRQARAAAAEAPDAFQQTAVLHSTIEAALARGLGVLAEDILREALGRVPLIEPADSRAYALDLIWCRVVAAGEALRRPVVGSALANCDPNRGWRTERLFRHMVDELAEEEAGALIAALHPGQTRDRLARRHARRTKPT
jgi:hypothetical protein